MDTNLKKISCSRMAKGSAFILMIVLTSLLAIIAVMFMLSARMQKFSTSSMQDSKALDFAVETVVSKVSEQIAKDVPGNLAYIDPNDPNNRFYQEYYDYPSHNRNNPTRYDFLDDKWLANLEPEYVDVNGVSVIGFRHISDVFDANLAKIYNEPNKIVIDAQGDRVSFANFRAVIIDEHRPIYNEGDKADADGDGVSDSRWVKVPGTSVKGQPVYAAVRVIDNAAMLNTNTSGRFDPNSSDREKIDGSSQLQIDFVHLSQRGATPPLLDAAENRLNEQRSEPNNIAGYENDVLWKFSDCGRHKPYDIGDELSLRNRFFLKNDDVVTRIENLNKSYNWRYTFKDTFNPHSPLDPGSDIAIEWFRKLNNYSSIDPCYYDIRHLVTTYSLERARTADGNILINGGRMISLNKFEDSNSNIAQKIYDDLVHSRYFKSNFYPELAQIIANLKDYTDNDSNVTVVYDANSGIHYGWEKPDMYITELAYEANSIDPNHVSYAIEIFKTTADRFDPCDFRVVIDGNGMTGGLKNIWYPTDSNFNETGSRFIVITYNDPNTQIEGLIDFNDSPVDGAFGVNPDVILKWDTVTGANYDIFVGTDQNSAINASHTSQTGILYYKINSASNSFDPAGGSPLNLGTGYYWRVDANVGGNIEKGQVMGFTTWAKEPNYLNTAIAGGDIVFGPNTVVSLQRRIYNPFTHIKDYNTVDMIHVPPVLSSQSSFGKGIYTVSCQRDMSTAGLLKRVWDSNGTTIPTLGRTNSFSDPFQPAMEAYHGKLNNIGDIGRVLKKSPYVGGAASSLIQSGDGIYNIKVDLEDPNIHSLFKYLERITDINLSPLPDKIKGRININTAPWYVIARLPWVSAKRGLDPNDNLARAIVAYRDLLKYPVDYSGGRYAAIKSKLNNKNIYVNENPGFENIGELNYVIAYGSDPNYSINFYEKYGKFTGGFPYIGETGDIKDVSVKRNLIFSRISDLVTVRSDVFTAYILVRIGTEGSQRRVIAILDRSDALPNRITGIPQGKVKIVAIQPVLDPR